MAVHRILNTEWATAIPAIDAALFSSTGAKMVLTMQNTVSSTATPITLNIRCTTAARLAFLLVPTQEISAVTQVPMFWPMIMGTAAA